MKIFVVSALSIVFYFLTATLLARRLVRAPRGVEASKLPYIALGLGAVVLHGSVLYQDVFTASGINLGFFNAASLTAWLIALLLLLSAFAQPVENLGIVVFPIAALMVLLENLIPASHVLPKTSAEHIEPHIIISVLAYSLLSIAAIQSIVLALQDRRLRHKHPGGLTGALPPLQVMESLLFQMIGLGFIFLSLSLLSGIVYLEDIFAQHLVHKTVLSIVAWAVFGVLLWGRWHSGWRGRTAIRWTLGGFVLLLLAYFGSKLVLELILGR